MLNKEEIEKVKIGIWNTRADTLKAMQCSLNSNSEKQELLKEIDILDDALKYMEQLEKELKEVTIQRNELATKLSDKEDDKQKLIEKLEEDIINANDNIQHMNDKNILQVISKELAVGMRDYAQEILKIVKGEKE